MRYFSLGVVHTFSLTVLCTAMAAEPPADAGKRAFSAGVALLQDPDGAKYEDALHEFRKAYQLLKNWKVLGNIGLCALELERDGEAIEAYQGYLAAGGAQIETGERQQVERDLGRLKSQVVTAHFESAVVPATLIDERVNAKGKLLRNEYPLRAATIDLGLHPGHHVITVRSSQGETRFVADLASGGTASHKFDAPPRPVTPIVTVAHDGKAQRIAGAVVAGAGVAAAGVGAWLALTAKSRYAESEPYCRGSFCDAQGVAIADDAREKGNLATIVLGGAAVAAAAGVILWVTAPPSRGSQESADRAGVSLGVTPLGVRIERSF